MNEIKVGQEVYRVGHYSNEYDKVEKVGRKYIYLSRGRKFHKDTLREVHYVGIADRIYLRKEEYDKEVRHSRLSDKLGLYEYRKLDIETLEQLNEILEKAKGVKNE